MNDDRVGKASSVYMEDERNIGLQISVSKSLGYVLLAR
jgi:hypothetical protein